MTPRQGRHAGFTLLEILVALSILAIGLAAASRSVLASTDTVAALQSRQLARWVAENQVALLRASRSWPETGLSEGSAVMGQQTFQWRQRVEPAVQSRFRRIELSVYAEGSPGAEPLARLVGFVVQP